jgi:hypothetical protein
MSIEQFTPLDLEAQAQYSDGLSPKVIYAGNEPAGSDTIGQPYVLVSQDYVALVGDASKVISVSPEFGVGLSGPISFSALPDQISVGGGYWRINPLVLTTLPSTTVTPVPWLVPATPRLLQAQPEVTDAVSYAESNLGMIG